MKKFFITFILLMLGCHPTQLISHTTPNKQLVYTVECHGLGEICYREAEKICAGTYTPLEKDDNRNTGRWFFQWRRMSFVCGGWDEYSKYRHDQDNTSMYDDSNKNSESLNYYCFDKEKYVACANVSERTECYSYGNSVYCK